MCLCRAVLVGIVIVLKRNCCCVPAGHCFELHAHCQPDVGNMLLCLLCGRHPLEWRLNEAACMCVTWWAAESHPVPHMSSPRRSSTCSHSSSSLSCVLQHTSRQCLKLPGADSQLAVLSLQSQQCCGVGLDGARLDVAEELGNESNVDVLLLFWSEH